MISITGHTYVPPKLDAWVQDRGGKFLLGHPKYSRARQVVTNLPRDSLLKGPFSSTTIGHRWLSKRLYITEMKAANLCEVIHEVAHVFATTAYTNDEHDETAYLGWEIAMAKYLDINPKGCRAYLDEYILGDGGPALKELAPSERADVLAEKEALAIKTGLVRNGIPQAVR